MARTLDIWNGLVDSVKALLPAEDVRAYPLNKIQDLEFYKALPDLGPAAVLLVLQGDSDHEKKNERRWSALLINKDPAGKASELTCAKLDALRHGKQRLLNTEILRGRVWVKPGSDAGVAASDPDYSVIELVFHTLEANEEDVTE